MKEAYQNAHLDMLNPNKKDDGKMAMLDHHVKKTTNEFSDKIQNCCKGAGLIKLFPDNNLQLMVNCQFLNCFVGKTFVCVL